MAPQACWKATATRRSGCSDAYVSRPRVRSPTSASLPLGAGCQDGESVVGSCIEMYPNWADQVAMRPMRSAAGVLAVLAAGDSGVSSISRASRISSIPLILPNPQATNCQNRQNPLRPHSRSSGWRRRISEGRRSSHPKCRPLDRSSLAK